LNSVAVRQHGMQWLVGGSALCSASWLIGDNSVMPFPWLEGCIVR